MSMQASDCSTKGVLGEIWAASILLECSGVLCTWAKHNQAYLFAFTQGLYLKQNWPKNKHLIFGCMCSMASQIICNCVNLILFPFCRRLNLVVELLEYCFYLKVSLLVNERKNEFSMILKLHAHKKWLIRICAGFVLCTQIKYAVQTNESVFYIDTTFLILKSCIII